MLPSNIQTANRVNRKRRSGLFIVSFMLASALLSGSRLTAAEPPPDLVRRVAQREAENEYYRSNYAYHQTVMLEELDDHGAMVGSYREARDVVFLPGGERVEKESGHSQPNLKRLKLTPEDFRDMREIQPLLLTTERLFLYEAKYKGVENIDGQEYFVLQIKPKQVLTGMRLFEGILWIDQHDFSVVRSEGQAVPQIRTLKEENLFPHFTTIREKVDGKYWFPLKTFADDSLPFRTGLQRIRMTIRYSQYQKFGSASQITFQTQP